MPIKPENRDRYPANWSEIREQILERAGHCCEQCKAPNSTIIWRGFHTDRDTYMLEDGTVLHADTGEQLGRAKGSEYFGRPLKIVLTVAHLDHTPENCAPDNLRAWCQRCHLRYDAKHHAENAQRTRRARKAIGELFA